MQDDLAHLVHLDLPRRQRRLAGGGASGGQLESVQVILSNARPIFDFASSAPSGANAANAADTDLRLCARMAAITPAFTSAGVEGDLDGAVENPRAVHRQAELWMAQSLSGHQVVHLLVQG